MAISPQQLTIYLYSAHRAVIFAIAQLSCFIDVNGPLATLKQCLIIAVINQSIKFKFISSDIAVLDVRPQHVQNADATY